MTFLSSITYGFGFAVGMSIFFFIAISCIVSLVKANKKKETGVFTPDLFRMYLYTILQEEKYEEAEYVKSIIMAYERGDKPTSSTLTAYSVKNKTEIDFNPEKGITIQKSEWIERLSDFIPDKA